MQLLKPVWVTGDGQAFMSIDIHPDGIRFATGGQGEDCGRVSIWNIKPILDEKAARDKEVPKLLTQMDHHLGCVNCVRWSNSGKYLASGGDDKLVRTWFRTGKDNIYEWCTNYNFFTANAMSSFCPIRSR